MEDAVSDNNEPVSQRNSRENLHRMLDEIIEHPERRSELTQTIENQFSQEKAILVLDMHGFSRTTRSHGIVSFLLMIHQMKLIAGPCVDAEQGLLLKAEADNLFCLFDSVAQAVRASLKINDRLSAANTLLPENRRLYVAIGIGYGSILNVDDEDLFGNEVNTSSKLGEDIAGMGDILLTAAAKAKLEGLDIPVSEEAVSISGLDLTYYKVQNSN